jgi:hypothetical protein
MAMPDGRSHEDLKSRHVQEAFRRAADAAAHAVPDGLSHDPEMKGVSLSRFGTFANHETVPPARICVAARFKKLNILSGKHIRTRSDPNAS